MKTCFVYIMSDRTRRLYIGVTSDLERRVYVHKHRLVPGFTSKYYLDRLVYFEDASDPASAIAREKELKGWLRSKKVALIEAANPNWSDLSREWMPGGKSLRGDPSPSAQDDETTLASLTMTEAGGTPKRLGRGKRSIIKQQSGR